MKELLAYGSVGEALSAIIHNLFSFEIYAQFTWQQWTIIGIFLLFSSAFYLLTNKIVNKISQMRNKKESEINSLSDVVDKIKEKIKKK